MSNIHPLLVHFPITLLTVSVFFDVAFLVSKKPHFEQTGWWTLLAGSLGLAATVASGILAEQTVTISHGAREHFETHQQLALLVAGAYSLLLLWRIANRTKLPTRKEWAFVGLSCLAAILVWVTGWYGGEMVFRYGIGVHLQ
jgi:uncharacterized membrane protein